MDQRTEQAFDECLALWKVLSERKTETYITGWPGEYKQQVLNSLGIGERKFGCPFCQIFRYDSNCPLGDCSRGNAPCLYTPYRAWIGKFLNYSCHTHSQKEAKDFYDYLIELYENLRRDVNKN